MMDSTVAHLRGSEQQLCRDSIREILLKLPVKSLVRFKQVSKKWMRIIKSNRFASEYYRYSAAKNRCGDDDSASFYVAYSKCSAGHKRDGHMRVVNGKKRMPFISGVTVRLDGHECKIHENMPMPRFSECGKLYTYWHMFPAGFGLYCVSVAGVHRAALWNPATREVRELPRSPFYRPREFCCMFAFARVAYEDGNFSYKVGMLTGKRAPGPPDPPEHRLSYFELHLYSSGTASWRLIPAHGLSFSGMWPWQGVNLRDAFHVLAVDADKNDHIMTFQYDREEFGRIALPDAPQLRQYKARDRAFLTVIDDRFLCLVFPWAGNEDEVAEGNNDNAFLDVWVMREYGVEGSWSKECTTGPVSNQTAYVRHYSKSVGGIFLESWEPEGDPPDSGKLRFIDCASSAVKNLPISSECWGDTLVMDRTDSLVRIPRPKFQWASSEHRISSML